MLALTDEPEVTEDTRFYLFFEATWAKALYAEPTRRTLIGWDRWKQRINAEVSEATYREAQAEAFGLATSDFTLPLDDHWWGQLMSSGVGWVSEATKYDAIIAQADEVDQ